jgi:hypothetical protein
VQGNNNNNNNGLFYDFFSCSVILIGLTYIEDGVTVDISVSKVNVPSLSGGSHSKAQLHQPE